MTTFELPVKEGKPTNILDFKVDLLLYPPEIKENIIETVDKYVSTQTDTMKIDYKDAPLDEGRLNIYLCWFKTGKCCIHIFGKIRGKEFRTEKEITTPATNNINMLNKRIKYVLISSRNILRTYYLNASVKSIEEHLMAFVLPV